jgi:hypothetical protein
MLDCLPRQFLHLTLCHRARVTIALETRVSWFPQRRQELVREPVALIRPVPDCQQVAPVDAELQGWEDKHAEFVSGSPQYGVPVDSVVVRDRQDFHSGIDVRLHDAAREALMWITPPSITVSLPSVSRCVNLEIGEVEA